MLIDGYHDISKFKSKIEKLSHNKNLNHDIFKQVLLEEQNFIVCNDAKKFAETWDKYHNYNDHETALKEIKNAVFEKINYKNFKKNPEYSLALYLTFFDRQFDKTKESNPVYENFFNLVNSFAIYFLLESFKIDRIKYHGTAYLLHKVVGNLCNYYTQNHYFKANHLLLHVFENLLSKILALQKLIPDNEKVISWLYEKLYEIEEHKKYSSLESHETLLRMKEIIVAGYNSFLDPSAKEVADIKVEVVTNNITMRYFDIKFYIEYSIFHRDFDKLAEYQSIAFEFLDDLSISSKDTSDQYELSQIYTFYFVVLSCLVDSFLSFPELLENKNDAEKNKIMMFIGHKEFSPNETNKDLLLKGLRFQCLKYLITDDKSAVVDNLISYIEKLSKKNISVYDQIQMFESFTKIYKLVEGNEKLDSVIYSACIKIFDKDFQNAYDEAISFYKNCKLSKIIYGEEPLDLTNFPQKPFVLNIFLVLNLLDFIPDPGTDDLRKKKHYFYSLLSSMIGIDKISRKYITIPFVWCLFTLKYSTDEQKKKQANVFLTMFLLEADLEEDEISGIIIDLKKEMQDNAVELFNIIITNLLFPMEYGKVSKDITKFQYKKSIMHGLDFKAKSLLKYLLESEIETMHSSDDLSMFNNVIRSWDMLSFSGLTLATRVFFTDFFRSDKDHVQWYKTYFKVSMAKKKYYRIEPKIENIKELQSLELKLFNNLIEKEKSLNSTWFTEYFNLYTHFGWLPVDVLSEVERINYSARDFWNYMNSNDTSLICFSPAQEYSKILLTVLSGDKTYSVIENISISVYSKLINFTKTGKFSGTQKTDKDEQDIKKIIDIFTDVYKFIKETGKNNIIYLGIDEFAKFPVHILPISYNSDKFWIDEFNSIVHIRSIREAFFPNATIVGTFDNKKPFYCFGNSTNSLNFPKIGYKVWLGLSKKYGKDGNLKAMKDYEKLKVPIESLNSINNPYPAIKIYSHMTAADINTNDSAILIDGNPYKPEFNENYNMIASNRIWELWGCESAADIKVTTRETDYFSLADYLLDGGAETVLSTLWPVSDFATALISEFYTLNEESEVNIKKDHYINLRKAINHYRQLLLEFREEAFENIYSELKNIFEKDSASAVKEKKESVIGRVLADLLNKERLKYFPDRIEFTCDDIASSIFGSNSYLGYNKNNVSGESAEIEGDLEMYCKKETNKIFDLFLSPEQWGAYIYLAACLKYQPR